MLRPPGGGGPAADPPDRPPLQAINGYDAQPRATDWLGCGGEAAAAASGPPAAAPPTPPGALALLAALRARVAAAEAALAARRASLARKRAMLDDAQALVGELCARTTNTTTTTAQATTAAGGVPTGLTPTSLTSRLLRSGDWAVTVVVRGGDAASLARAALALVPVPGGGGGGGGRRGQAPTWHARAHAPAVTAVPGRPATASLTAVVPRALALASGEAPSFTGPALAADAVVVVAPPAVAAATGAAAAVPAGRAVLGWDALLAREAGVSGMEEEDACLAEGAPSSSSDEEDGDGPCAAARTYVRLAAPPPPPPTLTAALARVLGPGLSSAAAGSVRLVSPDTIELAAPGVRRLARLAAGVAAALRAAGVAVAEPPTLPTATPASARRRAARLASAARAVVEEVDAVHEALVASLRLAEGGGEAGENVSGRDPGPAWAAASAAGVATDAAVAACWK